MIGLWEFWVNLRHISSLHKRAMYAASYGNIEPIQTLMDEEGCGAVFASYNEMWYNGSD